MATQAEIQAAFNKGVRNIRDNVAAALLLDALQDGDVQRALEAIDIEPAAFDELRGLLIQTYADAGAQATTALRGVRWNSASPRVELYARTQVGDKITVITEDMKAAVRETVADGYAFGRSPNRIARDLVGRIGPTGRREGGIVGLNEPQARWVSNMRRALQNDPASALRYTRRDRRFDRLLRSGKPLSEVQIENILRAYSNRLLMTRGRTIAVTERGQAINAGRVEAYAQAIEKYNLSPEDVMKRWVHTGRAVFDRPTHEAANGQTVEGLYTPFNIGGIPCQYPHDPFLPARESVNCRCEVKLWLK